MTHLATLAPLLGIVAAERTHERPDLFDDVRQEALIRAWEVERDAPEAPREYVLAAARNAATDAVRGRPGFGESGRRGWQDAHDVAGPLTVDDDHDVDTVAPLADASAARALEEADLADVCEAVRTAVRELPAADRNAVFLRFWQGMTWPQVAAELDRGTNATRVRFERHIAPTLRASLAA